MPAMSVNAMGGLYNTEYILAENMVAFSLNDDMSETAPFGESVLRSVYRSHKQKELLEDSIVIYRIQRAPERRVFYIDTGKMPPMRKKQYLETIKAEIRQKRIPSSMGGQDSVDSVYNPMSMLEDIFLSQDSDGRGSKVEVLPGGQGLGNMDDLDYFMHKVLRGLRVPIAWMKPGGEGAIFNDGKVGAAYVEEQQFARFVERLQLYIENVLDSEFKKFLFASNINVDPTLYKIKLPKPSNYEKYKQADMDSALVGIMGSVDSIQYLSKRFILSRYLQLSEDEIITNEELLKEERALDPNGDKMIPKLYQAVDQAAGGGGLSLGGMGGGMGAPGDMGAGMDDMGAMGGEAGGLGGEAGGAPGAAPAGGVPAAGGNATPT